MNGSSIPSDRIFVQVGPGRWIVTEPEPEAAQPAGLAQLLKAIWRWF